MISDTPDRAQALVEATQYPSRALTMAAGMSKGELIALALWLATAVRASGLRLPGTPPGVSEFAVNRAVLAEAVGVRNRPGMWAGDRPH